MRKILLYIVSVVSLLSCSQDISFNTPALQAVKDAELFRSANQRAFISDEGRLIIEGQSATETMRFDLGSVNQTNITFGGANASQNIVSFKDASGKLFTTENATASGTLLLTQNDDNSYTGTFSFTASRENGNEPSFFTKGEIYRIPFIDNTEDPDDLEEEEGIEEEEEEDEQTDESVQPDYFEATIDGGSFTMFEFEADTDNIASDELSGQRVIRTTGVPAIVITFPDDVNKGTYTITNGGTYSVNYFSDGLSGFSDVAQSGTLKIIRNDTDINYLKGTFSFITTNGVEVTNGRFSFTY